MSFIRQVTVNIGGKEFAGTGSTYDYKIGFNIQKHIVGTPNTAQVTIHNLSSSTIDRLQEKYLPVEIAVGHLDGEIVRVFSGELLQAIPERQGPDLVTTVSALDGGQAITFAKKIKTYDQVPISTIVEDLAAEVVALIPGGAIGVISVNGETGFKGYAVSASAQAELDRLAAQFGFSWSVQDGVFQAIDDNDFISQVWEVSKRTGLSHARKMLSGSFQVNIGVEIQSFLNPRVLPGRLIRLVHYPDSSFTSDMSGDYKVHNIEFAGDTHEDTWEMSLQCFTVGGI